MGPEKHSYRWAHYSRKETDFFYLFLWNYCGEEREKKLEEGINDIHNTFCFFSFPSSCDGFLCGLEWQSYVRAIWFCLFSLSLSLSLSLFLLSSCISEIPLSGNKLQIFSLLSSHLTVINNDDAKGEHDGKKAFLVRLSRPKTKSAMKGM